MSFTLKLSKEDFKFSIAHFAIFGPACAERLHGHNYYVSFELEVLELDEKLGFTVEFNEIKPLFRKICKNLDEFILIPKNSPYLKIEKQEKQIEVSFHDKVYSFPKEDVLLMPVVNISCEELARYLFNEIKSELKTITRDKIKTLGVEVQEVKNQKALYRGSL